MDPTGQANPLLAQHGYASAADQLAGWPISPVPFQPRLTSQEMRKAVAEILAQASAENTPGEIVEDIERLALAKLGA